MTVAENRSYHGRPVLKQPVWKPLVPLYFFTGGLAGASSTLALAAGASGNRRLARSATIASLAATAVGPPLLIADLGRPERFANMLRVAKPTSPMSVGSWVLCAFAPAAGMAAVSELTGRWPRLGRGCGALAGLLGPVMATYTAVLVADTAVPAWHEARLELPFLFAAGATASAGGVALALTPPAWAGPARRLATLGALAELGAGQVMEFRLGDLGRPYRSGRAATLSKAAKALTTVGALLALTARRRPVAVAAGGLTAAGGLLTRFAVFRAGFESAADPDATVGPQRRRLLQREAAASG